jgi:hypothetical protein
VHLLKHRAELAAQMVLDGEYLILDDVDFAALDFLAGDLVPVVPNLNAQLIDGIDYFRKLSWLFDPFLFNHQIGKMRGLNAAQRLSERYEIK